jgi:hypothetical protein
MSVSDSCRNLRGGAGVPCSTEQEARDETAAGCGGSRGIALRGHRRGGESAAERISVLRCERLRCDHHRRRDTGDQSLLRRRATRCGADRGTVQLLQFSAGGYWLQPSASALAALRRLSGGLEPVHAPAPLRVTVGGRPARDPASYSRLWTVGRPAIPVHPRGWIRVRITTATPTPWSDETTDVDVARRGGWLARDGTFFRVPATFAARVRARASLR